MSHLSRLAILLLFFGQAHAGEKDFLYKSAVHMINEDRCEIGVALLQEWIYLPKNKESLASSQHEDFLKLLRTAKHSCSDQEIFKTDVQFNKEYIPLLERFGKKCTKKKGGSYGIPSRDDCL